MLFTYKNRNTKSKEYPAKIWFSTTKFLCVKKAITSLQLRKYFCSDYSAIKIGKCRFMTIAFGRRYFTLIFARNRNIRKNNIKTFSVNLYFQS